MKQKKIIIKELPSNILEEIFLPNDENEETKNELAKRQQAI